MRLKNLPTQKRLRELLNYNTETGEFTRIAWASSNARTGDVAGSISSDNYRRINIDGQKYLAHRLAFQWMTGMCPDEIDHKDRNRSNNAWSNLRTATSSQNKGNQCINKRNVSGFKGVHWKKREQKWVARITIGGKTQTLGYYNEPEKAAAAYRLAAASIFGDYANPAIILAR
jgi:hypothetical protein